MTQPLFLETQYEKRAADGLPLSNDPTNWQSEIVLHVHEMLPYVANFQLAVQLDKVDDKVGFGVGYLTVTNNDKSVRIPLVVRDYELQPLDVFIQGEEFAPLSETSLTAVLADPRMFKGTVPQDDSVGNTSTDYQPSSGRYVYSSGSILDRIAGTVSELDKQAFMDALDEGTLARFQSNQTTGLIRKIASLGRPAKTPGIRPVHAALTPNVIQIEKIGYDQFRVRAVSDRLYSPVEITMSGDAVLAKFGEVAHSHALENNEFSTVIGRRPSTAVMLEGLVSEFGPLDKYTRCEVRTNLNDRVLGWLFPKVVNFDGVPMAGEKLFTDGVDIWAMQPDVVGREVLESSTMLEDPPSAEIKPGVCGVFYHTNKEGQAVCTEPVTITSPVFDMGDLLRFDVTTASGQCYVLEVYAGVETIMPSRRDRYTRYIPAKMRFCAVGKPQRLLDDGALVPKFAQAKLAARSVVEVSSLNGDDYNFAGTDCDALDGGASNVPQSRAKFHLMSLGMSERDAVDTLCRASKNGRCTVANLQPLLTEHEKSSQVRAELVNPFAAALPTLKVNLVKEAAFLPDSKTVDSVLSLNFVNLENLNTFMDSIPALKEAGSKLAQLLTAARIGFGAVPEAPAKKAMDNLVMVVENLESVKSAMRFQGGR